MSIPEISSAETAVLSSRRYSLVYGGQHDSAHCALALITEVWSPGEAHVPRVDFHVLSTMPEDEDDLPKLYREAGHACRKAVRMHVPFQTKGQGTLATIAFANPDDGQMGFFRDNGGTKVYAIDKHPLKPDTPIEIAKLPVPGHEHTYMAFFEETFCEERDEE